jgi:Nitrile hydratase, alpha chain
MNLEEQERKWQKIIVKAWMDDAYKRELLADPTARLKKEGVEIPKGVVIRIVEDTEKLQHLVLPRKPTSEELTENAYQLFLGCMCRPVVFGRTHC